jgi:hypothetical protein
MAVSSGGFTGGLISFEVAADLAVFLILAAFVAGVVNSIGGGGVGSSSPYFSWSGCC